MVELVWYAVRTKPTANPNRATAIVGGDFETYVDRTGRKRKRRIKNTGQREFVIETLLRRKGFHVFLPTKKVYRRKSKYTHEKQLVAYPLMVGWVFVGWPQGQHRWADLFSVNLVHEVAGIAGRPVSIPTKAMDRLFKKFGEQKAPDREQFMPTHFEFEAGDSVKFNSGSLEGYEVQVVDLQGPKAKVLLELFGRETLIDVDAMGLSAA